ncbi:MAG: GatB/YqeY domain-containing protein [Bacilli bacterium]
MIIDEIKKANIEALKNKDKEARSVLNVVISKYQLSLVEARSKGVDLVDADVISIIQKVLKELQDEKECYLKGNKLDRVDAITHQEETIKQYLPKQLSEEEIREEINSLADKSIPSIMKHFKMNFAGKVDMSLVNKVAKSL